MFSKITKFIFISDEVKNLTQLSEAGSAPCGVSWGFDSFSNLRSVSGVKILNNPNDFINKHSIHLWLQYFATYRSSA